MCYICVVTSPDWVEVDQDMIECYQGLDRD